MKTKKDIGKLFRENLDQMDFDPSEKVWDRIEIDLEKKKKKRRFFFWLYFTLITSTIATGSWIFHSKNSSLNVIENNNSITNSKSVGSEKNYNLVNQDKSNLNKKTNLNQNNAPENNKNSIMNSAANNYSKLELKANSKDIKKNVTNKNRITTNSKNKNTNRTLVQKSTKINGNFSSRNNKKIASINHQNEKGYIKSKDNKLTKNSSNKTKKEENPNPSNDTVASRILKEKTSELAIIQKFKDSTATENILTEKNTKKKPQKRKPETPKEKDSLEKTIEAPKEKAVVLSPYIGTNYTGFFGQYEALTKGNVIENKGKFVEIYGIMARYMLSESIGFQLGIGKLNSKSHSTIDHSTPNFLNEENITTNYPIQTYNELFSNSTKITLTSENSYMEIPIEAYYTILNKKIGISGSLGFSIMFLTNNEVFAESELIERTNIGTQNSLLPTSASANGKLYLYYKITPKLSVDLYPTFQYQIAGNSDSSNYSTYYFSIRTGLSYKL